VHQSIVRASLLWVFSAVPLFASAVQAQTFPYYGPSAFVDRAAENASSLQPPMPPTEEESTEEALDSDVAKRLKALEDLEKRFGSLEEDWNEFQDAQKEKKEADAEKPTMKINGRIQLDYWNFLEDSEGIGYFEHDDPGSPQFGTDPEDRVAFRRVRLEISGAIPQDLFYRMQIEFNNPSELEFKDVYLGFDNLPWNQRLLVGIQKRPLALDQWNSSRYNVFMERPTIVDAFDEDARRLGIGMWGVSDAETWAWQYGLFTLENPQDDGRVIGDSMQLSGNARLGNTFLWCDDGRQYAWFAASAMVAHPDAEDSAADSEENEARFRARPEARSDNRWVDTGVIEGADWFEVGGLEAVYNDGPFQVVGEWLTNWTHRDDAIAGTPEDLRFHGGYVYASYTLTGEHIPWDRETGQLDRLEPFNPWTPWRPCGCKGWGAWNVGARYSFIDLTDEDILGGTEQNVTLALNWHWTAYAKLQYDVGYGEIYDREPVGGFTSGNFWTSGLRLACDF
jgi:phosphate-selective porin OprO/OprP